MISYCDYKSCISKFYNEEPLDFLIYRPIAYLIVKLIYALPVSPNHVSFFAFLTAITAGFLLSQGTDGGFLWGGVGIILFSIWDCCDGMLARMKQNGSVYGKYVDRVTDLFANISFFGGACVGLYRCYSGNPVMAVSILMCGLLSLIHVATYQFYKTQLNGYMSNNPYGQKVEVANLESHYKELKENDSKVFNLILLKICLLYTKLQKSPKKINKYEIEDYVKLNKFVLPLWGIIAGSTHLTVLGVSLMTTKVEIYIFFGLILSNIWALIMAIIQYAINHNLRIKN